MKNWIFLFLSFALVGCAPTQVSKWWADLQLKSKKIIDAELRYAELEKAHEDLKREHFELEHKYLSIVSEAETNEKSQENLRLTGAKDGRSPADIPLEVPEDLDMDARQILAYQHLKASRFAEAAKVFDSFLWQPEGASQQNAKNFYEAGVAWFQVKNFQRAKICFETALRHADKAEKSEFEQRVDLWMRVLDKRLPASVAEEVSKLPTHTKNHHKGRGLQ